MMNLKDRQGVAQIAQDMDFMCAKVGRRLAGSPEEDEVASYVLERFNGLGLANVEKLPFSCSCWLPASGELCVLSCCGRPCSDPDSKWIIPIQQVAHSPATPAGGIEGELTIFEPVDWEKGVRKSDLTGKIGLFLGGYGESAQVFQQLHDSELEALIFVDTRSQTDWPIANGVGERFMRLIRKPMAYVSLMDAWQLARNKADRVRLTCSGRMQESTSWNVIGEWPGDDPQARIIVVSGHIDSVAVGQGADDNASGMAAVLECARRLRACSRRHSIRFIGFGAEEQLSLGSHRYVNVQIQDLDRVGFACNFDGIGAHLGLSTVMCTGTAELDSYARDVFEERMEYGKVVSDVSPYQDQFWFTAKGIPGVWITRTTHLQTYWYHHSEHNNLDVVSFEQIAWTAETACEMLGKLAEKEPWPFDRKISRALRRKVSKYLRELY